MGHKTFITASLDSEKDADILRWVESQENKSKAIRDAIRAAIGRGITLGDVYQVLRDLEREVKAGGVIVRGGEDAGGSDTSDEPPDVAAALDALADL